MGLIVLLMGFAVLSAAGLVGFAAAADTEAIGQNEPEPIEFVCQGAGPMQEDSSTYVPASPAEAAAIAAGDALFKNNCAQCHAVNEKVVGPALAGITKRRTISWLIPWVKNSTKVIAAGDGYAVKIFDENGKQQMPSFPQLSDKDITDIMAWATAQQSAANAIAYDPATINN